MDTLELTVRPTFESLVDEDYIEGDDEAIMAEQGVCSEPLDVEAGEEFEVPDGSEATVPEDRECFLAGEKDDFDFAVQRNGFWIDPTGVSVLSAGRYQYMGHGVVQLIMQDDEYMDDLTIGMRETEIPE